MFFNRPKHDQPPGNIAFPGPLIALIIFISLPPILAFALAPPRSQSEVSKLRLTFKLMFEGQPLVLNRQPYVTQNNDTVFIDELKFYVSNFSFTGVDGKVVQENQQVHLVDAEDSSTWTIEFDQPKNKAYQTIRFFIGTDSITNVSGALDGDLDPVKGMYWAWNTGYVAARLVGHSTACHTLHHAFDFHIGGYLSPYNSIRQVTLPIPGIDFTKETNDIRSCVIMADIGEWFKQPVKIDLSKTNSIVIPGKEAMMMADNYADMFYISRTEKAVK